MYIQDYKRIKSKDVKENDIIIHTHFKSNSTEMGPEYHLITKHPTQIEVIDSWKNEHHFFDNDMEVDVKLTIEEKHARDYIEAKQIVQGMLNKLYGPGDAVHEMWNGWIDPDPYDMAKRLKKQEAIVIGWFQLDYPKKIGKYTNLDIGIVIEYSDGERFWCHADSTWFKNWPEYYKELY